MNEFPAIYVRSIRPTDPIEVCQVPGKQTERRKTKKFREAGDAPNVPRQERAERDGYGSQDHSLQESWVFPGKITAKTRSIMWYLFA